MHEYFEAIGGAFGDSGTIGLIVQEYEETMTMYVNCFSFRKVL